MTLHIDAYSAQGHPRYAVWGERRRQMEGQEAVDYANGIGQVKGLPYFNGYVLQTALHDDGECDLHQPENPVWVQAPVTDGGGPDGADHG